MRSRFDTVLSKLASLPRYLGEQAKDVKFRRYMLLALMANGLGLFLVHTLTSKGVMGNWAANESVSKGMAPIGLLLNTLALTGRVKPTYEQTARWVSYWVPSATAGAACMGIVVGTLELGSLESRLLAGGLMFPIDYSVKRFIVYTERARKERLVNLLTLENVKAEAFNRLTMMRCGVM